MPSSSILRVGNYVTISDPQHPHYGETGPISDYDKVTDMTILDLQVAGKVFQSKVSPFYLAITGSQPIYVPVHLFDQVVVVNILSPMHGATGQVMGLRPRVNGMQAEIKETHSGVLFHFWAEELSPVKSMSLGTTSPRGVISTQQPTQAAPKFGKGDWVEVTSPRSGFNGQVGQVLDVLANGNLMLDLGGPSAVEVSPLDCKMYSPAITQKAIAQAQANPWLASPYDGSGSGSPEPDESEPDSYGVGQPKEKVFDHASLGTDLSGDELMKSIRDICGGH